MAKVIVFGLTELAEMIHFYLTHDSAHEVVAFTVDESYLIHDSFCGLPVLPFERIEETHPPGEFQLCICLGFSQVNRFRAGKYAEAKAKGYKMITYVSSKATTWPGVEIGENTIVLEQAVLMPFSRVGNNVFLSNGCLVGHHCTVSDHCFLSAGTVVLGCAHIGPYCILGANSTVKDLVTVADSCIIGVGVHVTRNTQPGQALVGSPPRLLQKSTDQLRNWITWSARLRKP